MDLFFKLEGNFEKFVVLLRLNSTNKELKVILNKNINCEGLIIEDYARKLGYHEYVLSDKIFTIKNEEIKSKGVLWEELQNADVKDDDKFKYSPKKSNFVIANESTMTSLGYITCRIRIGTEKYPNEGIYACFEIMKNAPEQMFIGMAKMQYVNIDFKQIEVFNRETNKGLFKLYDANFLYNKDRVKRILGLDTRVGINTVIGYREPEDSDDEREEITIADKVGEYQIKDMRNIILYIGKLWKWLEKRVLGQRQEKK
ncbi:hypothetical protein RCL_jg29150.t1 [Rhizophagus clarus]|uniref:Uncharacterized protein n=2 Tax=Rhizophagus clarus TaxID=94130 RepID=A0A8H3M081_9GLOM|nr:hypothetical protein RCL_jg29150.t1 [Rhizophagus clarus]